MGAPTILIVEADPSIRELFVDLLQLEFYEVRFSDNFPSILDDATKTRPNLLILELLPETLSHGLDVIEELRQRIDTASLPIIVSATNIHLLEQQSDLLRSFGCGVLIKPFEIDYLINVVRQQLNQANA